MAESDGGNSERGGSSRGRTALSVAAGLLNLVAMVAGILLLAQARTYTNIALVVFYLPALGGEIAILVPVTLAACIKTNSREMRAFLAIALVANLAVIITATLLNATCGARW